MAYSKVPETSIFLCSFLVKKAQKVTHENYINNLVTEESSHKFFLEMRKCVFCSKENFAIWPQSERRKNRPKFLQGLS